MGTNSLTRWMLLLAIGDLYLEARASSYKKSTRNFTNASSGHFFACRPSGLI